jgi:hypothetical protein
MRKRRSCLASVSKIEARSDILMLDAALSVERVLRIAKI